MGEDNKPGVGSERRFEALQHRCLGAVGVSQQILDGQAGQLHAMALGQFTAGGHDTGMLGITDQQLIALAPRQSPEGQNAAGTDVFGEGQS